MRADNCQGGSPLTWPRRKAPVSQDSLQSPQKVHPASVKSIKGSFLKDMMMMF
jgi:hypothetical protein